MAQKDSSKLLEETFQIKSILGGFSDNQYDGVNSDTYYNSVGIDPDFAVMNSNKTSGAIMPISYQKFSSAITGYAKWLATNPKEQNLYAYCSDGKVFSYDLNLANETLIGTPTSGAGNGMAYYNNYLYFTTPTDVARYGPLNGSPTLTQNFWVTTLAKTALVNTTYPSLNGDVMPNHPMHVHGDNFLYFGDFADGQGLIHKIRTKKVTNEGDKDDFSAYGAFVLPFGFMPTAIESYDTDLIVTAIQTNSALVNQGRSAIFLINPLQATFYRGPVYLPDPIASAMMSNNGSTYVFSGNAVAGGGMRVTKYDGGNLFTQEVYLEEGMPPFAGAVSALGNRICWGGFTLNPQPSASVFSFGYKKQATTTKALHNIVNTTSVGANPKVTALLQSQQSNNNTNRFVVAWKDDSTRGIDKLADTTPVYNCVFTSDFFEIGTGFFIKKIRIPFATTLAAGMTVTPVIYLDDASSSITLNTINSSNYSGRKVLYKQPELINCQGINNFQLELNFTGTVQAPVIFPIEIVIERLFDESN